MPRARLVPYQIWKYPRIHKLSMQCAYRFDFLFLQESQQPIHIYKSTIDALQMYNIRLFLLNNLYQFFC